MKIINADEENLEELNKLRNFNEIFRKDVTYDDIKSNKKSGLNLLSRRHVFGKTTGGVKLTALSLLRIKKHPH